MKKILLLTLLLSACWLGVRGQSSKGTVEGFVRAFESEQALIGANVMVKGSGNTGATTNARGAYSLTLSEGSYTLSVTYMGFEVLDQEVKVEAGETVKVNFNLKESSVMLGDGVVISANRKVEKITETPATIEVITADQIAETPTFNPGELLARQKGVDFVRSGVVGTGINVRGFNSNFNAKNLQVTDGRFSTLIATGLPFGPLNTVVKEDVERVEVILGPNSALYGPNAHNGLVNTITKDPRTHEGTTIAIGAGNQNMLTTRARVAEKINDKFAFKVSGEYTQGEEFEYMDSVYIGEMAVPEYDLDRDFDFLRGEAALYYTPKEGHDVILSYGGSNSTYLAPTNVGRNQIKDWRINYLQAKYVSPHFFAQVYNTWSKTDSTYSISDRTKAYYAGIAAGMSEEEAAGAQSYSTGALFIDDSKRWNAEAQYNNSLAGFDFIIGAQWQRDMANSHGTYLLDEDENDYITIDQYGGYGQLERKFTGTGLKAVGTFRADYHEVYGFNFLPKLGVVYTQGRHNWRLTYGKGMAAPTILNMYGNLFGGLILGNAEGFTVEGQENVEKQRVEQLQTIELGYKGQVVKNKLFVDANAYYNISEDFLSPVTSAGVVSQRGNQPIEEVQDLYATYQGLVYTYINFGQFDTYGADFGINYFFNDALSMSVNYSYFSYNIDEENMENDFNNDGEVNKLDLLVNAPNNKASVALNYSDGKFFGSIFSRWVQEYDYFSSYQIAAETQDLTYRGYPIVEDARSGNAWNYGPLGGFVTFDLSMGYRINSTFTLSGQVTNVFNTEMREFTASPPTGRLISAELKINLPDFVK